MSTENKVSYQTQFAGIKYSNNPLALDDKSFSNANNVYLNKYGALISRPPIIKQVYPWQVYGDAALPIELTVVGKYDLSNGGIIYMIYDTRQTGYFKLRYKSPSNEYSLIINTLLIKTYQDFKLAQYKQYYILFTVAGTRVLDTSNPANTWGLLSSYVDIPVTVIQTGNQKLELDGNQLTGAHKKQFVIKPDSDDTIYSLPNNETATITFPAQSALTYDLEKAEEYTRARILRELNLPSTDSSVLLSIIGHTIAAAYDDRVAISLDAGESFETIVYPTVGGNEYKNTASLSDDGTCFFYVHSNGVYRYEIGMTRWTLIEVTLTPSFALDGDSTEWTAMSVEHLYTGLAIDPARSVGSNYCHFISAERFAFALAYNRPNENDWILVTYTKGLTLNNLFDQDFKVNPDLLCSYAFNFTTPIHIISTSILVWAKNPYLNKRLLRILDTETVAICTRKAIKNIAVTVFKSIPTSIWLTLAGYPVNRVIPGITTITTSWTTTKDNYVNGLVATTQNAFNLLIREYNATTYWQPIEFSVTVIETTVDAILIHTITKSLTRGSISTIPDILGTSWVLHQIGATGYLCGETLQISSGSSFKNYTLPITPIANGFEATEVVTSGQYYITFDYSLSKWFTNLPIQTIATYSYPDATEFTQVPIAVFDTQHLWLGMNKTLWIGNTLDEYLSIPPINNNLFSKQITAIHPISPTTTAIFFVDDIVLCEETSIDNTSAWHYYPLKFSVGVRRGDTVITTNDGKFTIFPTKFGLAVLAYQLDIAATDQAITYITDDIKTLWASFYTASATIQIIHHNTQLIVANGTNQVLIYDFRTNGWYPLTFPANLKIATITPSALNYEVLELQSADTTLNDLSGIYTLNKELDELYTYATPYKDFGSLLIPWSITSQLLLLDAPNNYKNISQLIIDQIDSDTLRQSAYLTTQLFRQFSSTIKPAVELIYNIDTFAKIIKKVNWWKVLAIKWQLENDATSSYPTQLRLYNVSIKYDISYEVK